jgi:hypothetical protein
LIELTHQSLDELPRASRAERVRESLLEHRQSRSRPLDADLVEHAVRVKPPLHRPVHPTEELLHALARKEVIERRSPGQECAKAAALGSEEFTEQFAERAEVGAVETLGEEALGELGRRRRTEREEIVEQLVEALSVLDRIDDHAA